MARFSEAFKAETTAGARFLERLRAEPDLDWTFLSVRRLRGSTPNHIGDDVAATVMRDGAQRGRPIDRFAGPRPITIATTIVAGSAA